MSFTLQSEDFSRLTGRIENGGCLIVTGRESESRDHWFSAWEANDGAERFSFSDHFVIYKEITVSGGQNETDFDQLQTIPGIRELAGIFSFIAEHKKCQAGRGTKNGIKAEMEAGSEERIGTGSEEWIEEGLEYLAIASQILTTVYDLLENTDLRFITNDYTDALLDVKFGGGLKKEYRRQYREAAERKADIWLDAMEEEFSFSRWQSEG
jgi:hypothetical protein